MLETRIDIKKTALLVIDMQNDLIKATEEPFKGVARMVESKGAISNTARVIAAARKARMPVIFIGHVHRKDNADVFATTTDFMLQGLVPPAREAMIEGTAGAQIVDELKPASGEHVVWKRRSNAFYGSDLELMLRGRGVDTVILTGAVTNGCVANTARGAQERNFHVVVLSDCCVAMMPEDDAYFMTKVFPAAGRVRTSGEMAAAISGARA